MMKSLPCRTATVAMAVANFRATCNYEMCDFSLQSNVNYQPLSSWHWSQWQSQRILPTVRKGLLDKNLDDRNKQGFG